MRSLQEVTTGLFSGSISNPYDHSFPQNCRKGWSKLHHKSWPNSARHNGGLYWEPMGTYHRPIQPTVPLSTP